MVGRALLPLLLLVACESNYDFVGVSTDGDPVYPGADAAALCAGASRSQGSGFVAEICTAPLDLASQPAEGGGYRWVPGPTEIVSR